MLCCIYFVFFIINCCCYYIVRLLLRGVRPIWSLSHNEMVSTTRSQIAENKPKGNLCFSFYTHTQTQAKTKELNIFKIRL